MKTLLINISLRPESKVKLFPIGIGYIATAMKNAGFDFDLLDIDAHRYSDKEVDEFIRAKHYDVVAMGCIVTGYSKVKDLCARIRLFHRDAYIIVGNSVATSIYKTLLSKTEADVAVMGEGDITIVKLLKAIEAHDKTRQDSCFASVLGIAYKDNGKIYLNPPQPAISDISMLPHIDFSLFDAEIYIQNAKEQISENSVPIPRGELRALPLNTARGCIGNCTFCYHNFRGYKYRYRSMDSILNEISSMIKLYHLNFIILGDELTLFSRKRAEEFADEILASGLHFYWEVTCRADCFTKESDIKIMNKMKEAGCVGAAFSLESSDPEILYMMNKHITVKDFQRTARLFWQAGITPRTSLVIGYPMETKETIRNTFQCCEDCKIYPSSGFLLPQPGSVMYDYAKEHGFITDEEEFLLKMGDRQDLRINMTQMTDEEMEQAVLDGLSKCNTDLAIGLDKEHLVRTQYYRKAKSR